MNSSYGIVVYTLSKIWFFIMSRNKVCWYALIIWWGSLKSLYSYDLCLNSLSCFIQSLSSSCEIHISIFVILGFNGYLTVSVFVINRKKCCFPWSPLGLWSNSNCCKGKKIYIDFLFKNPFKFRFLWCLTHTKKGVFLWHSCEIFQELGLVVGTPVGTSLIDAHAGGVGVMESVIDSENTG